MKKGNGETKKNNSTGLTIETYAGWKTKQKAEANLGVRRHVSGLGWVNFLGQLWNKTKNSWNEETIVCKHKPQ